MDRLDAMRIFSRVVERRSFTAAAEDLGLPRSTVTDAVKQLEARLGVRLLQRTTRHVSATLDGEAYYQRCISILDDIDDAEGAFAGAVPKGLLRVDVHGTLARHFVLPNLQSFFAKYPGVDLYMTEGDRFVDLVREGIDCVLRVGEPQGGDMIGRRVAMLEEITCASPKYLERYGTPKTLDDLANHAMVGFRSSATGGLISLEFSVGGKVVTRELPTTISVNAAESFIASAKEGFGLIQIPRYHAQKDLNDGTLIHILQEFPPTPTPVSLFYPPNRQLSPRVRVFIDWLIGVFRETPIKP
ncbi:LysR family transcriptional regulator [Agrobacterium vitis]|uniref:LysR family transcriptional regulator n=1 Tax=Agrobacterium vitis TaxID=373 RepID=UPI0012E7DAA1|nr:LysR family transcriptional regulator [Agrobacterium vitis]MVA64052.1 LysR family transcriptional regulator [Agrobacterium vitis]